MNSTARSSDRQDALRSGSRPGLARGALLVVAVAVAYAIAGEIGSAVAAIDDAITLAWPAAGVALALMFRYGLFTWPGIMIAGFSLAATRGVPPLTALGIGVGHALGPLVAAWGLRRAGCRDDLSGPRDALRLTAIVIPAMVIPATVGTTVLLAAGRLPIDAGSSAWLRWWLGDVTGALLVAPVLLTLPRERIRPLRGTALVEALLLLATTLAAGIGAWNSDSPVPTAFLTLPPIAWAVLRFGVFESSVLTLVLGSAATWATADGIGPLGGFDAQTRHLLLASYLITITVAQLLATTILRARIDAERQLHRQRLLLGSVVDSVSDGIVAVDANGEVVVFNGGAERILGRPAREALGRPVAEVLPGSLGADLSPDFSRMAASGAARAAVTTGEVETRRSDGTPFPLEVSITRVAHEGQLLTTAVLRDLTDAKRAEQEHARLEMELRQSQKMEAIGTLAGGVAHDFNNILGAILGNAELLQMDLADGHPGRDSLGQIVKASKRARSLVQQILTFSRQREGTQQVISLEHVTQEALGLIRPSLPSNVQLAMQLDPRCPAVVADASQVHQVVLNLCTNALHAMRASGGTLAVSVEPGLDDRAILVVRDTGVGMTRDVRERIFEPFFTTRPTGEGTGLGLSVVHGIVRSHRGTIEVESEPGRGATFRVTFPGSGARRASSTPADQPAINTGRGERVLFVDDEAPLVVLGLRTLRRLGYAAEGCGSADEALALLRERPADFDLLVTDLSMPGKLGTALIAEARAIRPNLPAILATGYGGTLEAGRLAELGIRHVMAKPASLLVFARTIREALDDRGEPASEPGARQAAS